MKLDWSTHSSLGLLCLVTMAVVMSMATGIEGKHQARKHQTADLRAAHQDDCKYKKELWEECDAATNTQKRRMVLKKGNPACEPTKEIVRSCKPGKAGQQEGNSNNNNNNNNNRSPIKANGNNKNGVCRYKKGTWSECDAHTGLKTRTDTIKMSKQHSANQAQNNCEPTREMTKKCKATKLGCKYNRNATWSECDTRTNLRTKVLKLVAGSATDCEAERRVTKTCRLTKAGRRNQVKHDDAIEEDEEYEAN